MKIFTMGRHFINCSVISALLAISAAHAQTSPAIAPRTANPDDQTWVLTKTTGMKFYHPGQVFSANVQFVDIPEASYINSEGTKDHNVQMKNILNFLEGSGIEIGRAHV